MKWRTHLYNNSINGISLHSVGFELFKKGVTGSVENLFKYVFRQSSNDPFLEKTVEQSGVLSFLTTQIILGASHGRVVEAANL